MAKKTNTEKNSPLGLLGGLHKTAESQIENKENNTTENTDITKNNEENKPKSTRGRKKKANVKKVVKGKSITYTKVENTPKKGNKTFYLTNTLVEELEEMAEKVGLSSSELMEDAIQLLLNNSTLEGFNEE